MFCYTQWGMLKGSVDSVLKKLTVYWEVTVFLEDSTKESRCSLMVQEEKNWETVDDITVLLGRNVSQKLSSGMWQQFNYELRRWNGLDVCFWSWWSHGNWMCSPYLTTNLDNIYGTMVTVNNRQCRAGVPKRRETEDVDLGLPSLPAWREPRLWCPGATPKQSLGLPWANEYKLGIPGDQVTRGRSTVRTQLSRACPETYLVC